MEVTNTELDEQIEKPDSEIPATSFGRRAVGYTFNPSGDIRIGDVKLAFANIIDLIGDPSQDTQKRSWMYSVLRTQAINVCITAQMAVVKFITWID